MLDDRETEPATPSGAGSVRAEEALEEPRHVLFRNAGAVVGYLEHDPAVVAPERDRAGRSLARVPEHVLEQVLGDEPQHAPPQRDVQALVLDPEIQRDPGHLGPLGQLGDELAQDGCGFRVAERDHLALLLELAQEEDVVHQLPHLRDFAVRLAQERLQIGAGELGSLQQREQPRERRTQFVGDRRREAGTQLVVLGPGH